MTKRNLTTSFMVVAAGILLFGGVALAHDQQTRNDPIVPAASQVAATFDDKGVDATFPLDVQASDDHGLDATESAKAELGDDQGADATAEVGDDRGADATESPEVGDDHGADATESPEASARPSLDDKAPEATARATSSVDGGGHDGSH